MLLKLKIFTVSVMGLLAISQIASASGGRMGPQLSGDAIPVQLERAITLDDVQKVVTYCSAKAMTSTLEQITETDRNDLKLSAVRSNEYASNIPWVSGENGKRVYAKSGEVILEIVLTGHDKKGKETLHFSGRSALELFPFLNNLSSGISPISQLYYYPGGLKPDAEKSTYTFGITDKEDGFELQDHSIPFPTFIYSGKVVEGAYSKLGAMKINRVLVNELKLLSPPEMRTKSVLHLYNVETKKVIGATVDFGRYKACVLKKIQDIN